MAMTPRNSLRAAAILGALGVAAGAFGAHGLEARLETLGTPATFATAVRYHLIHALALGLCALLATRAAAVAAWCFLLGVAVFSGSLYLLALGGPRWLGAVTPVGGVLFLAGWVALATSQLPNR